MYKKGQIAKGIIEKQMSDGSWGYFHSLAEPAKKAITTEQALRRLELLGYCISDDCVYRAVNYMKACLRGEKEIPDPKEKTHDNKIFRDLMLATWIRKFTKEDPMANKIAKTWSEVISYGFRSGGYVHEDYLEAYESTFGKRANGDRLTDFVNYYQVSLTFDMYSKEVEALVFDHILNHDGGIYYIGYRGKLADLPEVFSSKQTLKYLACIEVLLSYRNSYLKLAYIMDWLKDHASLDNTWDFGSKAKDHVYLPLSDSWRIKDSRLQDSTYYVEKLIKKYEDQ